MVSVECWKVASSVPMAEAGASSRRKTRTRRNRDIAMRSTEAAPILLARPAEPRQAISPLAADLGEEDELHQEQPWQQAQRRPADIDEETRHADAVAFRHALDQQVGRVADIGERSEE